MSTSEIIVTVFGIIGIVIALAILVVGLCCSGSSSCMSYVPNKRTGTNNDCSNEKMKRLEKVV